MSLPDRMLEPDSEREFICHLCGDVKPMDDLAVEATKEYSEPVCWRCWEETWREAQEPIFVPEDVRGERISLTESARVC